LGSVSLGKPTTCCDLLLGKWAAKKKCNIINSDHCVVDFCYHDGIIAIYGNHNPFPILMEKPWTTTLKRWLSVEISPIG
jgi:hypothetical protein